MPSIINRAGVVPDHGEETGGAMPETVEITPNETKSKDGETARNNGEAADDKDDRKP